MVQWKGDITDDAGGRAKRLDSIESFQVPNFFVITREEIKNLFNGAETADNILNTEFSEQHVSEVKNALNDINVSSEVRNASGKARNLVEGQRNGGKVVVRVSGERQGVHDHVINVGSNNLMNAIKQVVASYMPVETPHDYPAIIIQKMIEPEASGAVITNYLGGHSLLELVRGLSTPLEDGETVPELYLFEEGQIVDDRIPSQQLETSVNPMNGSERQKTIDVSQPFFDSSEAERFVSQVSQEGLDVKFAYKRGTFYIIDAFEQKNTNPFSISDVNLEGIRVSDGAITGMIGREVSYSGDTLPPGQYNDAIIAAKGGYTSTDAQLARNHDKPAIFSSQAELSNGQTINVEGKSTEINSSNDSSYSYDHNQWNNQQGGLQSSQNEQERNGNTATEVLPLNNNRGFYTQPPFRGKYALTDSNVYCRRIPLSSHIKNYGDFFRFDEDTAVVDARRMEQDGLSDAMRYIDAENKFLIAEQLTKDLAYAAVKYDYTVVVQSERLKNAEKTLEVAERKFIIESLRNRSSE